MTAMTADPSLKMSLSCSALPSNHNRTMWGLWLGLVLLLLLPVCLCTSVDDCHGVRYAYRERGLHLRDVPRQPRQGRTYQESQQNF